MKRVGEEEGGWSEMYGETDPDLCRASVLRRFARVVLRNLVDFCALGFPEHAKERDDSEGFIVGVGAGFIWRLCRLSSGYFRDAAIKDCGPWRIHWAMPTALVIRAPGTNCDAELCRAFSLAGAAVELVHIGRLIREPRLLDGADLIGLPGGFSYGDDIASGRIFGMKLRERLYGPMREALGRGCLMIAPCNGFQVAVQVGLLPGPGGGEAWPTDAAPAQELSLAENAGARFMDRWIGMEYVSGSSCVWTRGVMDDVPEELRRDVSILPIAHGEGRLVAASQAVLTRLGQSGQVAVRYTDNLNGSQDSIAGICDASGRILGLMPHPERFLDWTRHPYWTRLPKEVLKGPTPGLRMFMNAVEAATMIGAKG